MVDVELDQHFLVDKEILKKIIDIAKITKEDIIYEIGPGKGILTKAILNKTPQKLISTEIDKKMEVFLQDIKKDFTNFEYFITNGLEKMNDINFNKLVANIPYSITEPLYKDILDKKVKFCVLLHGKKFYDRIVSNYSKWHYFVNVFYDVNLICEVSGDKFVPKAKTTSCVVLLKLKENLNKLDKFIQILFSKNERNLRNALVFSIVDYKREVEKVDFSKKEAQYLVRSFNFEDDILKLQFDLLSNKEFVFVISKLISSLGLK